MTDDKLSPRDGDVDPSGENLAADLSDPGEFELAADETEAEELENADESIDDTLFKGDPEDVVVDDPEQLAEAESLAAKARSSRPVKRRAAATDEVSTGRGKRNKAAATDAEKSTEGKAIGTATVARKRSKAAPPVRKRTTPAQFASQSVGELKKVNWPTGDQLRQYFRVVLVFVVLIIAFVGVLDLAFGWTLLKLLGGDKAPVPPQ